MIKFNIKKLIAIALMSVTCIGVFTIGASAAWKQNTSGWWYTEGNSWATGWRNIDGNWYYFSPKSGYMFSQTVVDGYYLNENGAWVNDTKYNVTAVKAQELVKKYLSDNGKFVPPLVRCSAEEGNSWVIRCYEDMVTHTATYGWYYVDKKTGEIVDMNTGKIISSGQTTKNEKVESENQIDKAKSLINENIDEKDKQFLANGLSYVGEITESTTTDIGKNIYKATGINENMYKFNAALGGAFYVGKESGKIYLLDAGGSIGFGFYLIKNGVRVETWYNTRSSNGWKCDKTGKDWINVLS